MVFKGVMRSRLVHAEPGFCVVTADRVSQVEGPGVSIVKGCFQFILTVKECCYFMAANGTDAPVTEYGLYPLDIFI